jgi:CDP-glucose 4,6-dehydratase
MEMSPSVSNALAGEAFLKNVARLSWYSGKRILLTGHTGFKGAWLAVWLHRLGARVTGYSLDPPTEPSLYALAGCSCLLDQDLRGDLRNPAALARAFDAASPEVVFHLAAQPLVRYSYRAPKETFDTNVGGTVNVLEQARESASVKAAVVVTSDKCYENREWVHAYRENDPMGGKDPYSASKGAAELVAQSYLASFFGPLGKGLASCRAGNVIGGGDWALDRIIPDTVRAIRGDRSVGLRNPDSIRPWQHVLDPLFGYLLLGARLSQGERDKSGPWNFGPPPDSCQPVRALVQTFLEAHGSGSWEDVSGALAGAPHEARFLALAWDKAHREMGWSPRWGFGESVTRAGRWYKEQALGASALDLCLRDISEFMGEP